LENKEKELTIYDQIGKILFYLGDLETAQYYHSKFTSGEPDQIEWAKSQSIKLLSQHHFLFQRKTYTFNNSLISAAIKKKKYNTCEALK
jgi:hypothetical protein